MSFLWTHQQWMNGSTHPTQDIMTVYTFLKCSTHYKPQYVSVRRTSLGPRKSWWQEWSNRHSVRLYHFIYDLVTNVDHTARPLKLWFLPTFNQQEPSCLPSVLTRKLVELKSSVVKSRTYIQCIHQRNIKGAGILGPHLQKLYGENGFAMIVDEGCKKRSVSSLQSWHSNEAGYTEQYGTILATPGIAEKGFLNVLVEVTSPGGHSSIPPEHTVSHIYHFLLSTHFETEYRYSLCAPCSLREQSIWSQACTYASPSISSAAYYSYQTRHEPMYDTLQCVADHAKSVPSNLRKIIKRSTSSDQALRELTSVISQDKLLRSLISTTQAVDLIQGGVKSNALPERAWAIVNRRIAVVRFVHSDV